MEVKKIGALVKDVVKKMHVQERYHQVVYDFLKTECKVATDDLQMETKEHTLFLYMQDPQRYYQAHLYLDRLQGLLKKEVPESGIDTIVLRIKSYGRS